METHGSSSGGFLLMLRKLQNGGEDEGEVEPVRRLGRAGAGVTRKPDVSAGRGPAGPHTGAPRVARGLGWVAWARTAGKGRLMGGHRLPTFNPG